jgi:hypothetical protein
MTNNYEARRAKRRDEYEAPQAIRLNDSDRAYGLCAVGSTPGMAYRAHDIQGTCVTGKSAGGGCYAGAE